MKTQNPLPVRIYCKKVLISRAHTWRDAFEFAKAFRNTKRFQFASDSDFVVVSPYYAMDGKVLGYDRMTLEEYLEDNLLN